MKIPPLPVAVVAVGTENLSNFGGGALPFNGLPAGTTVPGHIGPFSLFSVGVGFDGQIFDLTLFRRYQASRNSENASKFDSQSTREQVILLVVSQYIGTLRATADVRQHALPERIRRNRTHLVWRGTPSVALMRLIEMFGKA